MATVEIPQGQRTHRISVIAVISDSEEVQNAFCSRLYTALLRRLHDDELLSVRTVGARNVAGALMVGDFILNLSCLDASQILGSVQNAATLIDLRYSEGSELDVPVSFLSRQRTFMAGETAVRAHRTRLILIGTLWQRHCGCLGSIGAWEGRSHEKSATLASEPMILGAYGILNWFWAHVATGAGVANYSQFVAREFADSWPTPMRRVVVRLSYCLSYLYQTLRNRWIGKTRVQWSIGIGLSSGRNSEVEVPNSIRWIRPSPELFVADPFVLSHDGSVWLFFEELRYAEKRGFLVAAEITASGEIAFAERVTILSRDHHLSFPSVFKDGDQAFLIPEQASTRQVTLFRCDEFPRCWVEHATLLEGFAGADPVLLKHRDHWYLFVSDASDGNHDNNLLLFSSKQRDGPYHRHPSSPIRLGLRGSRMAGRIISRGDAIFRVGQDCHESYGGAVSVFLIETLSEVAYGERFVANLMPTQALYAEGLHSYAEHEGVVVIDGFSTIPWQE